MPKLEKMCQSLNLSKSISEHHQHYAELSSDQCVKKVHLTFNKRISTVIAKSCWLNERPINCCLDKRRKWIISNWIILATIISEYFKFNKSNSILSTVNMIRFSNLNKINSSSSCFYILIASFLLLINTSTVGKSKSFMLFKLLFKFALSNKKEKETIACFFY